jgi:hypothetical protein
LGPHAPRTSTSPRATAPAITHVLIVIS